jgi:non-heme chloroperoxidase
MVSPFKQNHMEFLKINKGAENEVRIHYQDCGKGKPVVLIHGWPLSHEMWEYQVEDLVNAGYRVITYDRRGFGQSSKPYDNYTYDILTDDLKALMDYLGLQDVTLVGFSMGGGEVARYFSKYGGSRVSKVVLISSILPYLLQTDDNPEGVDESVFKEMLMKMKNDRIGFLESFGKQFFGINLVNKPVSTPLMEYYRMLGSVASPKATVECAKAFSQTDFRSELGAIQVPTLIIHGTDDRTVPIEASSYRTAQLIKGSRYIQYEGAPHGLFYTDREKLNDDLIAFIKEPTAVPVNSY